MILSFLVSFTICFFSSTCEFKCMIVEFYLMLIKTNNAKENDIVVFYYTY